MAWSENGGRLRARFLLVSVLAILTVLTPVVADAVEQVRGGWELVDEDSGFRRAEADGWTRNYRRVRFYAGHPEGESGSFDAAWAISCRGGFEFSRSRRVRDFPNRYWTDVVSIPSGEGRCDEIISVRSVVPRNTRLTAGIETR